MSAFKHGIFISPAAEDLNFDAWHDKQILLACRMAASFGSGFVYSLVSGSPNPVQAAITTGLAFAVFNGLFYQVIKPLLGVELH